MIYLYLTLGGAVALGVNIWDHGLSAITPDGQRYQAAGRGAHVPHPFSSRWFLPRLLGPHLHLWAAVNFTALVATIPLLGLFLAQHGVSHANLWAALLFCGLPGVWYFPIRAPILVDPASLCLALASAVCIGEQAPGLILTGVVLACVAGTINEKAPVFAALFAWSLWPLIGLLVVAFLWWRVPTGPDVLDEKNRLILEHPIHWAKVFHLGQWLDPLMMVLPWGLCLFALGTDHFSTQLIVVLVVAYAQLLVATDSVRLYQWAAPVVILTAAPVLVSLDLGWVPILAVHLANPWRGDGI